MDLLKSIEVFREVCKQKSFSKAANQLNLVPSAVSRQISELEKHLGVRMLNRTTRSISLTEDGKRYLQKMDAISQSVGELKKQVSEEENFEEHIRLTAPPLLVTQFLTDTLNKYLQQHPEVSLSTLLVNREVNLVEEGYDMALRVGDLHDSNLVARVVGEFSLTLVASPVYLDTYGVPKHPKEIAKHSCLINTLVNSPRRWNFKEGRRKFSVKVDGRYDVNDDDMLRSFACSGLGIAYLPANVVSDQVRKGNLVPILKDYIPDPLAVSIVYPSRQLLSLAKRKLIDSLAENAQRDLLYTTSDSKHL